MEEDVLILVVFNRLPTDDEIEGGIDEYERMIDSTVVYGDSRYEMFIESEEAHQLDFNVTAMHYISEEGYITGVI